MIKAGHRPPEERGLGFRGSVKRRSEQLVHAIARTSFHRTICGLPVDKYDDRRMNVNGEMFVPNCLRCWTLPEPI